MSAFTCEMVQQPTATIVKLGGQMNLSDINEFDRHFKAIVGSKPSLVVVDLSDLQTISSAGIGGLLRLQKTLSGLECNVRLAALPDEIARILTMARLTELFKITDTVEDAIN